MPWPPHLPVTKIYAFSNLTLSLPCRARPPYSLVFSPQPPKINTCIFQPYVRQTFEIRFLFLLNQFIFTYILLHNCANQIWRTMIFLPSLGNKEWKLHIFSNTGSILVASGNSLVDFEFFWDICYFFFVRFLDIRRKFFKYRAEWAYQTFGLWPYCWCHGGVLMLVMD